MLFRFIFRFSIFGLTKVIMDKNLISTHIEYQNAIFDVRLFQTLKSQGKKIVRQNLCCKVITSNYIAWTIPEIALIIKMM